MSYNTILVERLDAVCIITLNRPDKLNSFNSEMHEELASALQEVENDKAVRALVLTGAGRAFSAGQDLSERRADVSGDFEAGVALEKYYNPLVRRLRDLPIPVITAVNGVAAGAGANIALSGDIIVAARSASFIQAFSRIGLIPDAGGTYLLTRQLGETRAKALCMLATPLKAEKALAWGLVWDVFDDDVFMEEVKALAQQLSTKPTLALGLTKQAIQEASANSYSDQLDLEVKLQKQAGKSHDFAEGVAAFLEKREARFTGN